MRLEISLHSHDPLLGELRGPDGIAVAFVGRLGLLSALDQLAGTGTQAEHADLGPGSLPAEPANALGNVSIQPGAA